jgi:cytochrome c peroxidase
MRVLYSCAAVIAGLFVAAAAPPTVPAWEAANPIQPLPKPPLGIDKSFAELQEQPTPERVRLGRWLFFDKRMSADGTVSCATCHRPENAFSEPTANSTGIRRQHGARKSPSFVNEAWTLAPNFFWDGRAGSLEEQALAPIANPVEMGNTHEALVRTLTAVQAYAPYFKEAFGDEQITKERVAKAIADFERTVMSGNSPWDRWKKNHDEKAVSDAVKTGDSLFFGTGACNQCHLGDSFTDNTFHNIGVGWDPIKRSFADQGRYGVTRKEEDRGAFKTPPLREVSRHAPYMHDGSMKTLKDTVLHYDRGGIPNPQLDPKMKALHLTNAQVDALVKFMEALKGDYPMPSAPSAFPK